MTQHSFRALLPWGLPVLSGVLIGTSYIPFPPWASLFAFVPLWLFWRDQTSLSRVFLSGLLTSFVFTLIGFNWVTYVLHEFAHLDWWVAGIGMLLFAFLAHLFVPLAGMFWWLLQRRYRFQPQLSLLMMAVLTILLEATIPMLFDWNFGYAWYGAGLPLYHWAEVVGFQGLSALTILTNVLTTRLLTEREVLLRGGLAATLAFGFLVFNLSGLWLQGRLPVPDAKVRVLMAQGNVGNAEKMAAELGRGYQDGILKAFMAATDQALKNNTQPVDFAMWPETAFPAILGEGLRPDRYRVALTEFLRQRQLTLLTGAYGVDFPSGRLTNSLFVVNPEGQVVEPHYSKTILLALGEYIPGEDWFPVIREWLPQTGLFARGQGPTTLLQWQGFKMGPQICYESLFPWFSRELSNRGAQFIVNVTNDSWYGDWQEPWQHMVMTLARGVEFRRPVLRVTNTGISTVGLASGERMGESPVHEVWAGIFDVPYLHEPPVTFYQKVPYLMPAFFWSTLLGLIFYGERRRQKGAMDRRASSGAL